MDAKPYVDFGIALAAGLLIGLERQQSHPTPNPDGTFLGGVRTFPLLALGGALSVVLGRAGMPWVPIVALLGVVVLIGISFSDDVRHGRDRGLTTEAAALVTFLLGGLAAAHEAIPLTRERAVIVGGTAVVVTLLLSSKPRLHGLAAKVSSDDLFSTVKFLIVAVLVLPLLPDRTIGPLDVLNPFQIGLMVVLIAGISFVGYVARRALGAGRGIAATALVGGLVSSTAVTLSFASRSKREPATVPLAAIAILLASTIMFVRVLVEVAAVHAPLLPAVAPPIGAMAACGLVAAAVLWLGARGTTATATDVELTNPFELGTALRMGLLFAVVLFASKAAQNYAGAGGMYVAALLAGTTDVDAITLSTANLAKAGLDPAVASATIVIGAASNTVVKAIIASVVGGMALGKRVLAACGAILATGAVVVLATML